MKQELIAKIQCWGCRVAAVMGYVSILGMIVTGLGLLGLALLLLVFTEAGLGTMACLFSGTVFTALGGVVLVQQLRFTYLDLRNRPCPDERKEVPV